MKPIEHKKQNLMAQSDIEFGKLGFRKKIFQNGVITYYKPYDQEDIHIDDITFLTGLRKVILYQGTELGSDAYRMDKNVLKAITIKATELGWFKDNDNNKENV